MDSNLVIKVKYGNTLRRFSVFVNGNGSVDVGMAGLEAKIRNLFKFTSDDDIIVTYVDEDQDVITLVDDDDLIDVVKQRLNPLRLNVQLKTSTDGKFETGSNGWSTPKSSQQEQGNPLSHVNSGVAEVLKSLPEPLGDVLSKLSFDLASKAASAPVLLEILNSLVKMGKNPPVPVSESQNHELDRSASNKVTEGIEASKVSFPEILSEPTGKSSSKGCCSNNTAEGIETSKTATTMSVPFVPPPIPRRVLPKVLQKTGKVRVNPKFTQLKPSDATSESPDVGFPTVSPTPVTDDSSKNDVLLYGPVDSFGNWNGDSCGKHPCVGIRSSPYNRGSCPAKSMPISGMAGADSSSLTSLGGLMSDSFRKSYLDSKGRIFHRGVQCDGCGVHPITGPRFKSKVRVDYDLCSNCFAETGNVVEYTRMDVPMSYPQPNSVHCSEFTPFPSVLGGKARGKQLSLPRSSSLDSCFVMDVSIPDGYVIAPNTPFTKIWRMRNSGYQPWPRGTELAWIGGYPLTTNASVSIKNEANGCPVGYSMDITVQFVSPGTPDRYVSYWRLKSQSDEFFGQEVWVLIQVDPVEADKEKIDSLSGSINSLNLNLPPKYNDEPESSQIIDMNIEPICDENPELKKRSGNAEAVKPMIDEDKDLELDFPIDNSLICGNSVPVSAEMPGLGSRPAKSVHILAKIPSFKSYPTIDSSSVPPVFPDAPLVNEELIESNPVEEVLLKELAAMGFQQVDLNREILRSNDYDLEQSLNDLCGVPEWDPILEELQEMGFSDKEKNTRLLMKNGGNLKRAVMDLVAGEIGPR